MRNFPLNAFFALVEVTLAVAVLLWDSGISAQENQTEKVQETELAVVRLGDDRPEKRDEAQEWLEQGLCVLWEEGKLEALEERVFRLDQVGEESGDPEIRLRISQILRPYLKGWEKGPDDFPGLFQTTPVVVGDRVVLGGAGWLATYSSWTGGELWKRDGLSGEVFFVLAQGDSVVAGGSAEGGGGWLGRYAIRDGKTEWEKRDLPGAVTSLVLENGSLAAAGIAAPGEIWTGVLDPESGRLLWNERQTMEVPDGTLHNPDLRENGDLVVVSVPMMVMVRVAENHLSGKWVTALYGYDRVAGTKRWEMQLDSGVLLLQLEPCGILLATQKSDPENPEKTEYSFGLYDAHSGRSKWIWPADKKMWVGALRQVEDRLLMYGADGGGYRLWCVRAETGETVWEKDMEGAISEFLFREGRIYAGGMNWNGREHRIGWLGCFDARTGEPVWEIGGASDLKPLWLEGEELRIVAHEYHDVLERLHDPMNPRHQITRTQRSSTTLKSLDVRTGSVQWKKSVVQKEDFVQGVLAVKGGGVLMWGDDDERVLLHLKEVARRRPHQRPRRLRVLSPLQQKNGE